MIDKRVGTCRFNAVSRSYDQFRPRYPDAMVREMIESVAHLRGAERIWMDVGCGTGIFTRQVADAAPPAMPIIGVEPARGMREEAIARSVGYAVTYKDAAAEGLPAADASIAVVSAATAAHWFDRPRFYAEASRVLRPQGVLAVVEYVRDLGGSPAAAALEAYLTREGGPKVYRRPDYERELVALPGFEEQSTQRIVETLQLDQDAFVGLALSSSHSNPCVEKLGEARVRADLATIADGLAQADGLIPYGYRFQAFTTRRR